VLRARSIWRAHAVAAFDLVLCGSRQSDKLSAQALDPAQPLAARLRADLAAQTAADLAAVAALLRADPALDGARLSLVGSGLGAALARAFAAGEHGLSAVVLEPDAAPDDAWLREVAKRLAG
jgi:dienelactone hydrolase